MITFSCAHCGRAVQARNDSQGQSVSCPHCMQPVIVPMASSLAPTQTYRADDGQPADVERMSLNEPTTSRKLEKEWTGHAVGIVQLMAGALATVVFFWALKLTSSLGEAEANLAEKFMDRGWTNYAGAFLLFWGIAILSGRYIWVRRRRKVLAQDLLPWDSRFASDNDIAEHVMRSRAVSAKHRDDVMGPRIRRALEHYRVSGDVMEVSELLREASDAANSAMESHYTLVRVALWTIPILGFIGTVIGVGDAVGGFNQFLSSAQELSEIKVALGTVTTGLSVAFDTTFVGLVLSVILMFVMSAVEKKERDQLQEIEDYCHNHLLRRLPPRVSRSEGEHSAEALQTVIREMVPGIETWKAEAQSLARALCASLEKSWNDAGARWFGGIDVIRREIDTLSDKHREAMERLGEERAQASQESVRLLTHVKDIVDSEQRNVVKLLETEQASVRGLLDSQRSAFQEVAAEQQGLVREYSNSLSGLAGRLSQVVAMQAKLEGELLASVSSTNLITVMTSVQELLTSLQPLVDRLAKKPLDVQVQFSAVHSDGRGD